MTEPSSSPAAGAAASSRAPIALSLMLGMFVCGLDTSIVNIMLPTLQSAFHVRADQSMMLATIYLTMLAALQLLFGRCADIFESAGIFLGGVVLFMLGSIGCALSLTFAHIMTGRVVQGIGGAMMAASYGALILSDFPRDKTGSVLGAVIMVMSFGTIIGPPLGGWLAQDVSWHWAFLINVPLCLIAATALFLHLRSKPRAEEGIRQRLGQLDLKGGVLSILMFASLPVGLSVLAKAGWGSPKAWALFGLFALSLTLFIIAERRSQSPLLRLGLFRDRALTLVILIKVALLMTLNGIMVIFPFFLTKSVGMSSSMAGMMMLANAATMAVVTPLTGKFTDRFGGNAVMACGSACLLAVSAASLLLPAAPPGTVLAGVLVLFGGSLAAVLISSTTLLLQLAPKGQEGIFSAINSLSMSVGGSLGLSFFAFLYALGSSGVQGTAAAFGGFSTALAGIVTCSGVLLALVAFHIKNPGPAAGR